MPTQPDISDEAILDCLQKAYGLRGCELTFLPLGADFNTVVYCVATPEVTYFLKLRRKHFLRTSVTVPLHLHACGLHHIIPPLMTQSDDLWTTLDSFKVVLYPYVKGHNGVGKPLSDQQWVTFGSIVQQLHHTPLPKTILQDVPQETFEIEACETLKTFLVRLENEAFKDPVAQNMASFLKGKAPQILALIQRAQTLSGVLQHQSLDLVLCHGDLHGWNLLIDEEEKLYVVDWDTLVLAPKERDLMFIGAGIHETGRTQSEEEALFYQGYGQTTLNKDALSFYRFYRIIQDMADYCQHVFLSDATQTDRLQSFEYLKANFRPQGTLERAWELEIHEEDLHLSSLAKKIDLENARTYSHDDAWQ